ncbi:protein kinase, partial [Candidatus Woesearchaeota archaeon]|nr:protein kinase [Candidatus Woesearchaeota archaeon]
MGATLAEYELISLISETGLSKVYHSKINHKDVAIKIAKPGCENPLINNFAVQSKLNHPNIIKVYMRDFDEETSSNFTVMEYFPFPRLSDYVEKNAVSFGRSLKILSSLFDAIKYSHSKDITHGDIHPKNILIS